ncbi:Phosphoribosyl 1,2-cyclic phosphodiesterase [Virgibacillus subterraneus]|uniref:Phosphoribosyl 1,2-cyclic phosphodiesterase n=1 Tax=Virgibacillus subterraneus TaxID=621109 RepID=A0A1H8YZ94_9BACI|nr:MBL fold metallo-hydrolase [Virgibacillus subterraneus]SEP57525.1 Phosphoribosyl 1,2-cyclic phosphodiesterase [Virgibacillus subterraneus]
MIEINTLASSSKGNCYRITDGSTPLLLEAGIAFKDIRRALNFNTSDLAGCLVTHEHGDHTKGLKDVLKAGIDTYMSAGTKEALDIEHHRINPIEAHKSFKIGTWLIMPFDVEHDVNEPTGYLLVNSMGEKLLFATDTFYIKYKFTGLTHLLLECNYSIDILNENIASGRVHKGMKKRLIRSHFSLENVKEFLKANDLSKVQEIHLLHLSDSNSDEVLFKKEIQEFTGKVVYIA